MMKSKVCPKQESIFSAKHERGVALLTVVALLSLFAVIGTAFTFTMRLEEQTARNFRRTTGVTDITLIGAEVAAASLRSDRLGHNSLEFRRTGYGFVDSQRDNWFFGFAGTLDANAHYMVRGHLPKVDPRTVGLTPFNRDPNVRERLRTGSPNRLFSLGVDEDPPGDLSGDGMPGWAGVDDDGDGFTDLEDPDVIASIARSLRDPNFPYNPAFDDDEDGLMDEDAQTTGLPVGMGLDYDNDQLGVQDESGKLNLNMVGNMRGINGTHRHNQGVTTFEIDPTLFFMARGVDTARAQMLTNNLILYRYGTRPGNPSAHRLVPGLIGDDNDNNDPQIIRLDDRDRSRVVGDGVDNDRDGLVDDPKEIFIGNSGARTTQWLGAGGPRLMYGDGIDNDGDGLVDESAAEDRLGFDEGVNEPAEFHPRFPFGDDNPLDTMDEIRLVPGFDADFQNSTIYEWIQGQVTVHSEAPEVSPALEEGRGVLLANQLNSYAPWSDHSTPLDAGESLVLSMLQVDNDGDWDPLRDDYNRNGRPDFDWDGDPEIDQADGIDNDGDGLIDDDGDFNQDGLIGYDPEFRLNEDPIGDADGTRDEYGFGYPGIGRDTDLATKLGPSTNTSVLGDDDGDGKADFDDDEVRAALINDPARVDGRVQDELDNDWNNKIWLRDGIDNDFDGLIDETYEDELRAGISPDLARDEGLDERVGSSIPDDLTFLVNANLLRTGDSLERYFPPFDDDEDGRMDEDPPEFDFIVHLVDSIDQLSLPTYASRIQGVAGEVQVDPVTSFSAMRFNPREVEDAFNRRTGRLPNRNITADERYFLPGGDENSPYSNKDFKPEKFEGISEAQKFELERSHRARGPVSKGYRGSEGLFISEIMVRPLIVLQSQYAAFDVDASVLSGKNDNLPAPPADPVTDTQWTIAETGDYYWVRNDPTPRPPTNTLGEDEVAVWEYPNVEIPAGLYQVYLYRTERDRSTPNSFSVQDAFVRFEIQPQSGAGLINEATFEWRNTDQKIRDGVFHQDNAFTLNLADTRFISGSKNLKLFIAVPRIASGTFTFDRIELFNPNLQYLEIVNLTPRAIDLRNYAIGLRSERERTPATQRFGLRFGGMTLNQSGLIDSYVINPFDQEDPRHYLLICKDPGAVDIAYPLRTGNQSSIPTGLPILEMDLYQDLFEVEVGKEYQKILNATESFQIVELYDPAGNVLDSMIVDFRVNTVNNTGFLAQQRGNPTDAKFTYHDGQFVKTNNPNLLYVSNADVVAATRAVGANVLPVDVWGERDYWKQFWEDNPAYPGRLAFRFGIPEDHPSIEAIPEPDRQIVDAVHFAFNLSGRFPDLDYQPGIGGRDYYYLDVRIVAPPWVQNVTPNATIGVVNVPYRVDALSRSTDVPLPWANDIPQAATNATVLRSGEFWKTIAVARPTNDVRQDTFLVVTIERQYRRDGSGNTVPLEDWGDIRIEAIELSNAGFRNQRLALELRGGTPGVPDYLPSHREPLVRDGRLPAPGYIKDIAASGPEWILSATDVARMISGFTAHHQSDRLGLINLNTAPESVLTALPWLPPRFFELIPSTSLRYDVQLRMHGSVAIRLVEGRSEYGIGDRFNIVNRRGIDDDGDGFIDEEPYQEVGDILPILGDRYLANAIENILRPYEPGFIWSQDEQLAALARVSALTTTRSNVFSVRTRGRVTDMMDNQVSVMADQTIMRMIRR